MQYVMMLFGLLLLVATIWDHFRLRRALLEQPSAAHGSGSAGAKEGNLAEPLPSITVVRPVRGLDVDADRNLAAALDNDDFTAPRTSFYGRASVDGERGVLKPVLVVRIIIQLHAEVGLRHTKRIRRHFGKDAVRIDALVGLRK